MGSAIREVLHDLWLFALGREQSVMAVVVQPPFSPDSSRNPTDVIVPEEMPPLSSGRAAHVLQREVLCYARPARKFDSRVGTLTYGEPVFVDVIEDGFARIRTNTLAGWVSEHELTNERSDVEPQFTDGEDYGPEHSETRKLRAILCDELDGGTLDLPLQPSEYVLYRLAATGIALEWPEDRPRAPGLWQTILRGHPRVRMSVEPKTNAVMECGGSGISPQLGFVEGVSPEEGVTVTYIEPDSIGTFRRQEFPSTAWRELRPIFISFV